MSDMDPAVWRVTGEPLVDSLGSGPLLGHDAAVKDLFAVQGHRIGAGNPRWLDLAPIEETHAWAVQQLIGAGAAIRGITHLDEFAYGLTGMNEHYGAVTNPLDPARIAGGSSSGSAAAVGRGEVSIGLGTDTAGSIRVPAAYQGLWGLRTTHDAVPRHGTMPLAETFDSIGWFTRSAALLREVGDVLLPERAPQHSSRCVLDEQLLSLADPELQQRFREVAQEHEIEVGEIVTVPSPEKLEAFGIVQAYELWQAHGWWFTHHLDQVGPVVARRIAAAGQITADAADSARHTVDDWRREIVDTVADCIVLAPSAPTVAPTFDSDPEQIRGRTRRLVALASVGGLPALSVPIDTDDPLAIGLCLTAGPNRDRDLLDLAADFEDRN